MFRHASCASGVAAALANARVWFVPPTSVGMAVSNQQPHAREKWFEAPTEARMDRRQGCAHVNMTSADTQSRAGDWNVP